MAGFFPPNELGKTHRKEGDPMNKNKLKSKIPHFRKVHLPLDRNEVGGCSGW